MLTVCSQSDNLPKPVPKGAAKVLSIECSEATSLLLGRGAMQCSWQPASSAILVISYVQRLITMPFAILCGHALWQVQGNSCASSNVAHACANDMLLLQAQHCGYMMLQAELQLSLTCI